MKYANCLVLALASLSFSTNAFALDYFVNPNGNDNWSGTLKQPDSSSKNGPFKTLERAKQAIKTLKQSNSFNAPVTIHIAAGHYYLNQPLHFDLLDSGFPGREIVWQGDSKSEVVISGGIPVTCKKKNEKLWECPLKQLPENIVLFNPQRIKGNVPKFELYANGKKFELARWPNQDWAHIKKPLDEKTQFSVMEKLPTFQEDIKQAQVHIFPGYDWHDEYLGLDVLDAEANSIRLSSQTFYPLASGRRFYIRNLISALDAPGEWIYDEANKKILLIPQPGTTPQQVIVTSTLNILNVDGSSHISFKDLAFQHSSATAINLNKVSNINLDTLKINQIGGRGVEIKDGQSVQLRNSTIFDTGGSAITVSGGDRVNLISSGNIISNNHIHDFGRVLMNWEPGLNVSGVGTVVAHNLIEQGPNSAIWISGNEHVIEKNEMLHLCLQTSDCGAIYSGRDWSSRGNIIRYNYLYDIIGYGMEALELANNFVKYNSPADARGIYLDDGASGFLIEGNIFENVGATSLSVGGGRDNKILNNYFKTDKLAIRVDDRWPGYDWSVNQKPLEASPYKSKIWTNKYPELAAPMHNLKWPEGNRIERNIFVSTKLGGLALEYSVPVQSTVIAHNLVWGPAGAVSINFKLLELQKTQSVTWEQWLTENVEHGSLKADPCVLINNNKMTTCPKSPIKTIGFVPLTTDIGLIK